MPIALAIIRWDNTLGAVLDAKVPEDYLISDEEVMRIYMSHTIGNNESQPFLTMKLGEINLASHYVKLADGSQFVIVLFLEQEENGSWYEDILKKISMELLSKRGSPGFQDYLSEVLETIKAETKLEEEIPKKILTEFGLSRSESEAYLAMVDKGPVSIGEIALYANVPEPEAENIAKRLLELGLLKPIPGTKRYFQAIPPYTALLKQLGDFREFLSSLRASVPSVLAEQFSLFEDEVNEVKLSISKAFEEKLKMKVFKKFIENIVQDVVGEELDNLKNIFQQMVIDALKDIIVNIDERVAVSEDTMSALWKRAKSAVTFRFTDVWFVTSREGFKAQILDMLNRIKTRAIIVTPEITDLNPSHFDNLKSWVNIRIATNYDLNDDNHRDIYDKLIQKNNVSIKLYPRKDLWAMDKDREEILIGAVAESGTPVGIASTVPEHIKMFMSIIEHAWVEARKI